MSFFLLFRDLWLIDGGPVKFIMGGFSKLKEGAV